MRSAEAQKYHFAFSLWAFARPETYRLQTGISGYVAKAGLVRKATRRYLHIYGNPNSKIFGGALRARTEAAQDTETLLRLDALNKMTALGMPQSYAI